MVSVPSGLLIRVGHACPFAYITFSLAETMISSSASSIFSIVFSLSVAYVKGFPFLLPELV